MQSLSSQCLWHTLLGPCSSCPGLRIVEVGAWSIVDSAPVTHQDSVVQSINRNALRNVIVHDEPRVASEAAIRDDSSRPCDLIEVFTTRMVIDDFTSNILILFTCEKFAQEFVCSSFALWISSNWSRDETEFWGWDEVWYFEIDMRDHNTVNWSHC